MVGDRVVGFWYAVWYGAQGCFCSSLQGHSRRRICFCFSDPRGDAKVSYNEVMDLTLTIGMFDGGRDQHELAHALGRPRPSFSNAPVGPPNHDRRTVLPQFFPG